MNWMTIAWPMVTGACLALALVSLRIAIGDGRRVPHLFFALAALAVAAVSGLELTLMRTDDIARYQTIMRWAGIPVSLMVASAVGFVWSFFRTGHRWLALSGVALNVLANALNVVAATPAVWHIVRLHKAESFGGVSFTVPVVAYGVWNIVEAVSVALVMGYIADASASLWRQGERRRAASVGGSMFLFLLISRGHAILIEQGMLQAPFFVSFSFLAVVIAMGSELSRDVLRAASLARDLRESEHRMELAGRAAALGFWNWDIPRDEIWASEAARDLFGVTRTERVNLKRFFETLHPDDREAVQQTLQAAIAGAGEYETQYRVQLPDGETRWIAARGRVEPGAAEPRLVRGVVMDITTQRRSEFELQQVRDQLAHAGRVSMLGQLASALAHELNQPLGAILRNAEAAEIFLESLNPDIDELRAIVSDIRKDDQRAGEVIDRLRAMLKRRELEACPLDVGELLSEAMALVRADAAERRIALEMELADDLPRIVGDRVHLQQVLLNLLLNAMDAMAQCPPEWRLVTLRANGGPSGPVMLSVGDTGHGIPVEKLPQVFDPFFTTKAHGMGMGLAISRTIVEAHGGRIWVENNGSGGGATFFFALPVVRKATP